MDLLLCRFVDVSCSCSIGETNWTFEVAPISHVDDTETCVAFMFWAQATIIRAPLLGLGVRIVQATAHFSVFFCSFVLGAVTPVEFIESPMFRTVLLKVDLLVLLVDGSIQDFEAFWAEASGLLDLPRWVSPLLVVKMFLGE